MKLYNKLFKICLLKVDYVSGMNIIEVILSYLQS